MKSFKDFRSLLKEADSNDGVINGNINLNKIYIKELPEFLKDITLYGTLLCSHNQLTSLKNCPHKIKGGLICRDNNISTLEDLQSVEFIYNDDVYHMSTRLDLSYNKIKSLDGLGDIGNGNLHINFNLLTSLQGCPDIIEGNFICSYNNLKTLVGGPSHTRGYDCNNTQITSLRGCAKIIGGDFGCSNNLLLTDITGFPSRVAQDIDWYNNGIELDIPHISKICDVRLDRIYTDENI